MVEKTPPPLPYELTRKVEHRIVKGNATAVYNFEFPFNFDVPPEACLPRPAHYRLPQYGEAASDLFHALTAFQFGRSMAISGLPGSGKDAFFHYLSSITRTPALEFQMRPGVDIQRWLFEKTFNTEGVSYERGRLLKALTEGYKTSEGRVVPYMILISDFDRADISQAEVLRMLTDSIQARVESPLGFHRVLEGTRMCFTLNSMGAGDERGRCTSSNPIDASILDRIERKIQFHWMDWVDEVQVLKSNFPEIEQYINLITLEKIVSKIRHAILKDNLQAEFSHRAMKSVVGHTIDISKVLKANGPSMVSLQKGFRVWMDGLQDSYTRSRAEGLVEEDFSPARPASRLGDSW